MVKNEVHAEEQMIDSLAIEKAKNRQIFLTILQNTHFLTKQGLAFCVIKEQGNFDELMKDSWKIDPRVANWIEKKQQALT